MFGKLCPIDFVFGKRRKINNAESLIGSAGKVRRQVVPNDLAAAFSNRLQLRLGVSLDIGEFIRVDSVSQVKRNHNCLR